MSLALQLSMDAALERDEPWSAAARAYIISLPAGTEFTSDALRSAVGDPQGFANAVGAVLHHLQAAEAIAFSGRSVMSSRPRARGRWVRVWTRV